MPLESLSQPFNPDEPGRKIREVQVEHEPDYEETAEERWRELKKTPLWGEAGELWFNLFVTGETQKTTQIYPKEQLLGVVIEKYFDPAKAKRLFLANRDLFEIEHSYLWSMAATVKFDWSWVDQFYVEYAKSVLGIDTETRKERYRKLQNDAPDSIGDERILLDLMANREQAKHDFDIEYYDAIARCTDASLHSALLATYIESMIYPERAKEDYEIFKQRWYNKDTNFWVAPDSNIIAAAPQLFDVLIRLELEKAGKRTRLPIDQHTLPEERNF